MHRHIELVAAGVFEHHELAVLAGHLHDLQALVAAHSIFFMNDRRARPQGGQIAKNRLRVGSGPAPAPLLSGALSEELCLAEHRDRRREDVEAGHFRSDAQREGRLALDELVPARDRLRLEPMRTQHLEQHFAPSRGVRGQQDTSRIRIEEILEWRERPFGAQVQPPFLWCRGRKIVTTNSLGRHFVFYLERVDVDSRELTESCVQFFGREVQLIGRQHRPFDVMAAFLVALGDALRGSIDGRGHVGTCADDGVLG